MRQCPRCKKWSLEFDGYFGRYRCFNIDCQWMPTSSTEREIKLLELYQEPIILCQKKIPELGLTAKIKYDRLNDVLNFDFGIDEATMDIPEADGRLVWKISHNDNTVVGFDILDAKGFGISEVRVDIAARKQDIERNIKCLQQPFFSGRPTKVLITKVAIAIKKHGIQSPPAIFREISKKLDEFACST